MIRSTLDIKPDTNHLLGARANKRKTEKKCAHLPNKIAKTTNRASKAEKTTNTASSLFKIISDIPFLKNQLLPYLKVNNQGFEESCLLVNKLFYSAFFSSGLNIKLLKNNGTGDLNE